MNKEEALNILIKDSDTNKISDGYHTFAELYDHRIQLFIAVCAFMNDVAWRSKAHSDGSVWDGWFIVGLFTDKGKQITYHLPISKWEETNFIKEIDNAPEWDGHTSNDVIQRISKLPLYA